VQRTVREITVIGQVVIVLNIARLPFAFNSLSYIRSLLCDSVTSVIIDTK